MKLDYVYTTYENKTMGFLFEDLCLTEAHFYSGESRVGEICTAKVEKVLPAVDAAFLIGPDQIRLFLPLKESEGKIRILRRRGGPQSLTPGDTVLVRIIADAQKNKLCRVSAELELTGEKVLVNLDHQVGISKKISDPEKREEFRAAISELLAEHYPDISYGVIVRTAASDSSAEDLAEETKELLERFDRLLRQAETTPEFKVMYQKRITPEERVFRLLQSGRYSEGILHTDLPFHVEMLPAAVLSGLTVRRNEEKGELPVIFRLKTLLQKALSRKVFLKDGGYLYVEITEAMTVIDVNSGKSIRGKDHELSALEENKIAATEIARLLRLRNLSGIIVIDFISMRSAESERELLRFLRSAVSADPVQVYVVDMTRLGLVEMTRKKTDVSLDEKLAED